MFEKIFSPSNSGKHVLNIKLKDEELKQIGSKTASERLLWDIRDWFYMYNNKETKEWTESRIDNYCNLICLLYPNCITRNRMNLTIKHWLVMTVFEDKFRTDQNFEKKIERIFQIYIENIQAEERDPNPDNWMLDAAMDIVDDSRKSTPTFWHENDSVAMKLYLYTEKCCPTIKKREVLSVLEYAIFRPENLGFSYAFNCIEMCRHKYVRFQNRYNPSFQYLMKIAKYICAMVHDVYACHDALKNNDGHNYVVVYKNEYKVNDKEAIRRIIDETRNLYATFEMLVEKYSKMFNEENISFLSSLKVFINGLNECKELSCTQI